MRAVLVFMITAAAQAFAPASNLASESALQAASFKEESGAIRPTGYFDPLKLVERGPYGTPEENFRHYRSVEIKHCRVSMAATVGMLVQQTYHFQGFVSPSQNLKFADIPNGLGALPAIPLAGWCQLIILIGLHEILITEGENPGDFGTGYLGLKLEAQSDEQQRALNVELSNGRLAMLGILGMFASESIHGTPLFEVTR